MKVNYKEIIKQVCLLMVITAGVWMSILLRSCYPIDVSKNDVAPGVGPPSQSVSSYKWKDDVYIHCTTSPDEDTLNAGVLTAISGSSLVQNKFNGEKKENNLSAANKNDGKTTSIDSPKNGGEKEGTPNDFSQEKTKDDHTERAPSTSTIAAIGQTGTAPVPEPPPVKPVLLPPDLEPVRAMFSKSYKEETEIMWDFSDFNFKRYAVNPQIDSQYDKWKQQQQSSSSSTEGQIHSGAVLKPPRNTVPGMDTSLREGISSFVESASTAPVAHDSVPAEPLKPPAKPDPDDCQVAVLGSRSVDLKPLARKVEQFFPRICLLERTGFYYKNDWSHIQWVIVMYSVNDQQSLQDAINNIAAIKKKFDGPKVYLVNNNFRLVELAGFDYFDPIRIDTGNDEPIVTLFDGIVRHRWKDDAPVKLPVVSHYLQLQKDTPNPMEPKEVPGGQAEPQPNSIEGLVIGNQGVGKTEFRKKVETLRTNFYVHDPQLEGDAAINRDNCKYPHIPDMDNSTLLKKIRFVIFMFASDDPESFRDLAGWIHYIKNKFKFASAQDQPYLLLVESKSDLVERKDSSEDTPFRTACEELKKNFLEPHKNGDMVIKEDEFPAEDDIEDREDDTRQEAHDEVFRENEEFLERIGLTRMRGHFVSEAVTIHPNKFQDDSITYMFTKSVLAKVLDADSNTRSRLPIPELTIPGGESSLRGVCMGCADEAELLVCYPCGQTICRRCAENCVADSDHKCPVGGCLHGRVEIIIKPMGDLECEEC